MTWLPEEAPGVDPFARVFGLRPELYEAWQAFAAVFTDERLVAPVLLELCRLRIAGMHGAAHPLSVRTPEARTAGLDEAKIAALGAWWKHENAERFSARAALHFAEQFVLDAEGVTDADAAALRAELGDAGLVAFVEALALFDGFARFARVLDIAPQTGPAADTA